MASIDKDTSHAPFASTTSPWSTTKLDSTALPPASRQREFAKIANENLSNGYSLFAHYGEPTLDLRRSELLSSGTAKKKFYKSVGKLWYDLPLSQKAFWNSEAARLRTCIKQKVITYEECVRAVGSSDQWDTYIQHAEIAVAEYLCIGPPSRTAAEAPNSFGTSQKETTPRITATACEVTTHEPHLHDVALLDTFPDQFTVEPRMLYGHFAHYDLEDILTTPTRKRQLEKLRQVADLFDQTGKVLFHYYVYPRLWKKMRPLDVDESIATAAQNFWHYSGGQVQEQWSIAELSVKKMLGDGDLEGLALLRLDSMDPRVLRLHEMAEAIVGDQ